MSMLEVGMDPLGEGASLGMGNARELAETEH